MTHLLSRRDLLLGGLAAAALTRPARAEALAVDLELIIAVDVSGSIDPEEAQLQRNGYIEAFGDPRIQRAIKGGPLGRIAVHYFEWADAYYQSTIADWTLLDGEAAIAKFQDHLRRAPITIAQRTSISGAILYSVPRFGKSGFAGARRVIDISGDGPNNDGGLVTLARELALKDKITINGLPIVNDRPNRFGFPNLPDLDEYYEGCVIGGKGAFVVVAKSFNDFATAVKQKLFLEVSGVTADQYAAVAAAEGFVLPTYWAKPAPRQAPLRRIEYANGCDIGERQSREFWRRRNFEQ